MSLQKFYHNYQAEDILTEEDFVQNGMVIYSLTDGIC